MSVLSRGRITGFQGLLYAVILLGAYARAADYGWTTTAAGTTYNWDNTSGQSNWSGGGFPNAVGDAAYVTNNIVGNQTIRLNQAITVGTLKIGDSNGAQTLTVLPNGGSLILDNGESNAVLAGSGTGSATDLFVPDILLNSPLTLSGSPTTTHQLSLNGAIAARDGGQSITVSGGSVIVTNTNLAYANGWTIQSNATVKLAGRPYRNPNYVLNYTLGTTGVANAISILGGGALACAVGDMVYHASGPITMKSGAAMRQMSGGGGRIASFADVAVESDATALFSYMGDVSESRLRLGTLALAGEATLNVSVVSGGASAGGNVLVDPVNLEAISVLPSGTIGSTYPDFTTAEGLVVGSGRTLTKTGSGTLLLNSTNGQFFGSIDVQAGILSLGHKDALNATSGNIVRSNAVVALRATGFGTAAGKLSGASVAQEDGSAERWYYGAARFGSNTADAYTPPCGGALQIGLYNYGQNQDWYDSGSSAKHVLRLNGGCLGVWAEMVNSGWGGSTRAGFIGFSWANTVGNTLPASSDKYAIVLDADSFLGSPDSSGNAAEYRQLFINASISNGTAGTSITKIGPETVILSGANTYSGATVINGGTLAIGRTDALPVTTELTVREEGVFDLFNGGDNTPRNKEWLGWPIVPSLTAGPGSGNGLLGASCNQAVAGLAGGGIVANGLTNRAVLTVISTGSRTFSGNLTGPLALVKSGDGTLVLTGTNYYSEGTTVSAGTLVANGGAYVPGGTVTGNFGNSPRRTVVVTNTADVGKLAVGQPVAAAILPEGAYVTGTNGTTFYLSRFSTNASSNQLAVAVSYGAGAALGTGPVTVSGTGTLTLNGTLANANITVSGGRMDGAGTVRLNVNGASNEQIVMSGGALDVSGLSLALQTGASGVTESEYVLIDYSAGGTLTQAASGVFAAVTGVPEGYAVYDKPLAKRVVLAPPPHGTLFQVR